MYYSRGNITETCPIKNAHHSYERERFNAKRKFVEFMRHYQKGQSVKQNNSNNNDQFGHKQLQFSEYVRMMETRTSDRPLNEKLEPINNYKRRNFSSQVPRKHAKENNIIESCQPYFLTTISRPSSHSEFTKNGALNYSKLRRVDPLPPHRAKKLHNT